MQQVQPKQEPLKYIIVFILLLAVYAIDHYIYDNILYNLLDERNIYPLVQWLCYTSIIYLFSFVGEGKFKGSKVLNFSLVSVSDKNFIGFGNLKKKLWSCIYTLTCMIYYGLLYYYRDSEESNIQYYIILHNCLSLLFIILCISISNTEKDINYPEIYHSVNITDEIRDEIIRALRKHNNIEKLNDDMYSITEIPKRAIEEIRQESSRVMNYVNNVFGNADRSHSGDNNLVDHVINDAWKHISNLETHGNLFDEGVRKNAHKNAEYLNKSIQKELDTIWLTKEERYLLLQKSKEVRQFQTEYQSGRKGTPPRNSKFTHVY
jgi:predicted transcriptional regulator